MNWQSDVTDPDEVRVFKALDGPSNTWRTISGIARQTGLPESRVRENLARYNRTLTRLSDVTSLSGQALAGLIENVGA